jgi:hypothetical protein
MRSGETFVCPGTVTITERVFNTDRLEALLSVPFESEGVTNIPTLVARSHMEGIFQSLNTDDTDKQALTTQKLYCLRMVKQAMNAERYDILLFYLFFIFIVRISINLYFFVSLC